MTTTNAPKPPVSAEVGHRGRPPQDDARPPETHPYWGGSSALTADIRRLRGGDFATLVTNYFDSCPTLPITAAQYHAMSEDDQKRTKDGPYVLPCCMRPGTTKRKDANAESVVLACLDIDESTLATRLVDDLDHLHNALRPFNYVAHHTLSSTPEAPRLRIIVACDHLPPDDHRRTVTFLLRRLGLPASFKGVRESKVLSQPMYRPAMFSDSTAHPVVGSRTDGRALTLDDLPVPGDPGAPGAPDGTPDQDERTFAYPDDLLATLAHLPIPDITPEDIAGALDAIDPDCDYKTWVTICAALKHQFRDPAEARRAFDLFDDWSSRGSKYRGHDETASKWRSFAPNPERKTPVTLRSLLSHAIQAGWNASSLSRRVEQGFDTWLENAHPADILREGIRRIAESPFPSSSSDCVAAGKIVRKLKSLGGQLTQTAVLKDVARARREAASTAAAAKLTASPPGWLRGWVFLASANMFHKVDSGMEITTAAFNNMFAIHMMPSNGITPNGRPEIMPADHALNQVGIPRVELLVYDPRYRGEEPIFSANGRSCLNLYRLSSLPLEDPSRSGEALAMFTRLLDTLIGAEYAPTMLDFAAWCVQRPGEKIRWAPVIQSGQGAGKGMLLQWISAAAGPDNVGVVSPTTMSSSFNDWAFGKHVLNVDELHTAGGVRSAEMNKIKDLISNDRIALNIKYRNSTEIDNTVNVIVTTNYLDTLHLDESDRRYWVIQSPLQTKAQIAAVTRTGVYADLARFCADHPGAIRSMLLEHQVSRAFNPDGPAPETVHRAAVIANSRSALESYVRDLVADPEHPAIGDDVLHYAEVEQMTSFIKGPPLYRVLTTMGYVRWGEGDSPKFRVGSARTPVWVHRDFDESIYDPVELLRTRMDSRVASTLRG